MEKEFRGNKKINKFRGLLAIILFSAVLFRLHYVKIPITSDSELSCWNLILRLAGKEGMAGQNGVGVLLSFGYCLPFSILIRRGVSLLNVYKMALIINGFFLALVYLQLVKGIPYIVKGVTDQNSQKKCKIIEGGIALLFLFPVFYSQAIKLGPQIILAFLVVLIEQWTEKIEEESGEKKQWRKILWTLWLGIFLSPLFAAVAAGWCAGEIISDQKSKKYRKQILQTVVVLFIGIIVIEAAEYVLISWLQADYSLITEVGVSAFLELLMDGVEEEGILGLFFGISGKGTYLFVNTLGLAFLGLYHSYQCWKEKKKSLITTNQLCVLFTVFFSAVWLDAASGQAGLPTDNLLSIAVIFLMISGVDSLLRKEYNGSDIIKIGAFVGILTLCCKDIWRFKDVSQIDWAAGGALSLGKELVNRIYELPILASVVTAILCVGLCFGLKYLDQRRKEAASIQWIRMGQGLASILLVSVIAFLDVSYVRQTLSDVRKQYVFSYGLIGNMISDTDRPVYYYCPSGDTNHADILRLWAVDTKIIPVQDTDELEMMPENAILLSNKEEEDTFIENYQRQYETDQLTVWENNEYTKESTISQYLIGKKVKLPEIKSGNLLRKIYGARTTWSSGTYKVKIKLTIKTGKKEKLGLIKVLAGTEIIGKTKVRGKGANGEQQTLKIKVKSAEEMENFRIVIEENESGRFEINEVNVTKIGDE